MVARSDKILPYYVLDVAANVPGLPGLFLAGLVSAGLSTMSAGLNTVTGIIYEDFIDPWMPESNDKETKAANIMKVQRRIYYAIRNRKKNKILNFSFSFVLRKAVSLSERFKQIRIGTIRGCISLTGQMRNYKHVRDSRTICIILRSRWYS